MDISEPDPIWYERSRPHWQIQVLAACLWDHILGSVEEVYIEWGQYLGHAPTRDKGDLSYTFAGTEHNFQVEARAVSGFHLRVRLGGITTWNDHQGIAEQLALGIRFFDIRPVIAGGEFYTGHYGNLPGLGWQGVNGQSIRQIVQQMNSFTAINKEVVILSISHDFNTDAGRDYRGFNQEECNGFVQELTRLDSLFASTRSTTDLTLLTMNQLIGNKQAAVIVVVSLDRSHFTLGDFAGRGFYYDSQFPFYDNYANSNDPNVMIEDQLRKLNHKRDDPDRPVFSLDWTLTQRTLQDVTIGPSILEMASFMDPRLVTYVIPSCSSKTFPNILSIDKVDNATSIAVTTAINTLFAS